ncbi:MAG TPA: CoA-disulfide reductase [Clostridiales bacterium]|nr:CoA-disulfide reductase [Clostridiales bacterium]
MKIVVVGGVAAGASAAAKARRTNEHAHIVLFEKGSYISFANCGLPYYIGDYIKQRDHLLVVTEETFKKRHNIDVRTNHEVIAIDRKNKRVLVKDLTTEKEFYEDYDKLILAPGARPIRPQMENMNLANVFTVTTIPDVDQIKELLSHRRVNEAVVVGGGYIGVETAEALRNVDVNVTIVELSDRILPGFDIEMTSRVMNTMVKNGIEIVLGRKVVKLFGKHSVKMVQLDDGTSIPADLVLLTAGIRPNIELAQQAGLKVNKGIIVDNRMQTSDPDIYAAGDAVEVTHIVTQKPCWTPLAGPANKQGRVAGANAAGDNKVFKGCLGTSIMKIFDLTLAKTGLTEKEAKDEGLDYEISYTHSANHAEYFPGSRLMSIKLIWEKGTKRVLGAQIVGREGVDKRIDVLATAIYGGFTLFDLEQLDLAYSPPYSSAKDPVIIAGFVAANIARDEANIITAQQLKAALDEGEDIDIIDVRTPGEYDAGHIKNARLIPLDELRDRLGELDKNRTIVVYCTVGHRSYHALRILWGHGFKNVKNLSGGYISWRTI